MTTTRISHVDFWQEAGDPTCCGDLVIVEQTASAIRVVLADACGHGPRAARVADDFEKFARPSLHGRIGSETFDEWNRRLYQRSSRAEFVAATVVELDLVTARCVIWNAGNPAPHLLRRCSGALHKIETYGLPLGAFGDDVFEAPEPMALELLADDSLVLITDGVTDQCRGDEPFGEHRYRSCMMDAMIRGASLPAELRRAIEVYRSDDAASDDMNAVVIHGARVNEQQYKQPDALAA